MKVVVWVLRWGEECWGDSGRYEGNVAGMILFSMDAQYSSYSWLLYSLLPLLYSIVFGVLFCCVVVC